jgi:hypothetical protein
MAAAICGDRLCVKLIGLEKPSSEEVLNQTSRVTGIQKISLDEGRAFSRNLSQLLRFVLVRANRRSARRDLSYRVFRPSFFPAAHALAVAQGKGRFTHFCYGTEWTGSPNGATASRIIFSSPTAMMAMRWAGKYFRAAASTSAVVALASCCP